MKIDIVVITGFAMPVNRIITLTDSNRNNLNLHSVFCVLFYTKMKVLWYVKTIMLRMKILSMKNNSNT